MSGHNGIPIRCGMCGGHAGFAGPMQVIPTTPMCPECAKKYAPKDDHDQRALDLVKQMTEGEAND